jgi:hypothetical protein
MESEFYLIEKFLNEQGLIRGKGETQANWLNRLNDEREYINLPMISKILSFHYRWRFDPLGLSNDEESEFISDIRAWLKEQSKSIN